MEAEFSLLTAITEGLLPDLWIRDLIALLGAQGLLAVFQLSRPCQQWVLQATNHFTVTLLAYEGLSDARWQRRLGSAVQILSLRGQAPDPPHPLSTRLVLRMPVYSETALQSIISLPPAAGSAVTELEVRQHSVYPSTEEGLQTPWLYALPAAFPQLRVLRANRLCGRLPAPASLPHLTELHLQLCPRPEGNRYEPGPAPATARTIRELCADISTHIPQLTALSLDWFGEQEMSWERLMPGTCPRLTHLTTDDHLGEKMLRVLLRAAPNLTQLSVGSVSGCEGLTGARWRVQEIRVANNAQGLIYLPQTQGQQHGLTCASRKGGINISVPIKDAEVRQHPHMHERSTAQSTNTQHAERTSYCWRMQR